VLSDSELLVKQMRGHYKVKSEDLRPLFERARKMSQALESFRIDHLFREQNPEADALVNQALDETSRANPASPKNPRRPPSKDMTMRLVARCKDGLLQPEEPLDLPDGTEVELLLRIRK